MINALIGFFIAILISALFTTRLYRLFFWYALNSFMLGSIAIILGIQINDNPMIITGIITIIVKFLLIPYFLKYITKRFKIDRKAPPSLTIQYSTIIIPIILVFTFYLVSPMLSSFGVNSNYVAIAISSLFLSLLLIIEQKNIAARIVGFLFIENSLFLLGISAVEGMPMLIELGIFVDLMMLIIIINLLFKNEGETI
jgi:hydrogenase-4 component E